jgi:hypothetical protein
MDQHFQIMSGVLAQQLGEELIIIHPKTDRIFLLNQTARNIWELLAENSDPSEVTKILSKEFAKDEAEIARDIDMIISYFMKEGFISK